jgi:putative membrane-bound dehydrogenase-like protein
MPRLTVLAFSLLLLARTHPALGADPLVPPGRAVERMKFPEGFRVTLVAGEPDLVKPIAMTTDERGRLWVVESHSYPRWIKDGKPGKDRVLIYEQGGDGSWSGKVFLDNGRNLSGIAVGFGGVWLCSTPELIFIPYRAGEDRPAGPAKVHLDGWSLTAQHNVFNGLIWGPDGWLYGLNGILGRSRVGRPGTPAEKRVAADCGVWRYHPTRELFEFVAWGTTNPWGLVFDDRGEAFITNCVIKHLFHAIPGGHYQRMFGQDLEPHAYGLMESCADHIHWGGGDWTSSRGGVGVHSAPGGGHAHAGALVYLGGSWPAEYRNRVLTCNIHGSRINQDTLERCQSGYNARHAPDLLLAHDPMFRGLGLQAAADGGVFVSDWHDTGECHNYDAVRPYGRVFKLDYGKPSPGKIDLAALPEEKLVALQLEENDWLVRQARRVLQERTVAGKLDPGTPGKLGKLLEGRPEESRKLRALWALYAVGALDEKALLKLLDHSQEGVRGWVVRLLVDSGAPSDEAARRFAVMGAVEKSPYVRLALASALRKMTPAQRWPLACALAGHGEDAKDPNLPLMIWYGIEPVVPSDPERAAGLIARAKIPLVRQYVARRLAALAE